MKTKKKSIFNSFFYFVSFYHLIFFSHPGLFGQMSPPQIKPPLPSPQDVLKKVERELNLAMEGESSQLNLIPQKKGWRGYMREKTISSLIKNGGASFFAGLQFNLGTIIKLNNSSNKKKFYSGVYFGEIELNWPIWKRLGSQITLRREVQKGQKENIMDLSFGLLIGEWHSGGNLYFYGGPSFSFLSKEKRPLSFVHLNMALSLKTRELGYLGPNCLFSIKGQLIKKGKLNNLSLGAGLSLSFPLKP